MKTERHDIILHGPVLTPEDGCLLGNGDLSASVYCTDGQIRFRFGKGDVWDRRLNFQRDARPAHIDEVARGILEEGWKCGPYGGEVEATKTKPSANTISENQTLFTYEFP